MELKSKAVVAVVGKNMKESYLDSVIVVVAVAVVAEFDDYVHQ